MMQRAVMHTTTLCIYVVERVTHYVLLSANKYHYVHANIAFIVFIFILLCCCMRVKCYALLVCIGYKIYYQRIDLLFVFHI